MEKEKLNKKFVWVILILMIIFAVILSFKNSIDKKANAPVVEQNDQEQVDKTWEKYPLDIIPGEAYPTELVQGNKEDLVSFSIFPNEKVSGVNIIQGIVKGGYFFEANILINILDVNKKVLKNSNAMATTDWMTADPVYFEGSIDFTGLPKGPAYFEIKNDNPSDLRENDKSILIPIIIE